MEIVPGEPTVGSYVRGVAKYSVFGPVEALKATCISRKRCKIGGKLVLITNRKLHKAFDFEAIDIDRSLRSLWPIARLKGSCANVLSLA